MSETRITTEVYLSGPKEKIIKILNNALSSAGMKPVVGKKEISALNRKYHSGHALSFTLLDFLDKGIREENTFKEMVPPGWDEDNEDYINDYQLKLSDIVDSASGYKFSLHASVSEYQESYSFVDFCKWCERMTLDYGFRIILHEVVLDAGCSRTGEWSFATSHKSCIFELEDGHVKETAIWPETDMDSYLAAMDRLARDIGLFEEEKMEFIIDDYLEMAGRFEYEAHLWKKKLSDFREKKYGKEDSKEEPKPTTDMPGTFTTEEEDGLPF